MIGVLIRGQAPLNDILLRHPTEKTSGSGGNFSPKKIKNILT